MIKVVITRVTTESYEATEALLVSETPTAHKKSPEYGSGRDETLMDRKWTPTVVSKRRSTETKLLEQEIADDKAFDLNRVILAINGISEFAEA